MRVAVLRFFLRVQWWQGPWRRGGSAWQRQFGYPQRVIRSARVPGRAKAVPARRAGVSAAMAAARACWAGGGGTPPLSQPGAGGRRLPVSIRAVWRMVRMLRVPAISGGGGRRAGRLARQGSKVRYGPAGIDGFLALAGAQPTMERRMRAAGLVCLGAGAGLIRGDLRDARGSDVACRSGGVVVQVRGPRSRVVPVLARYHARLLAAARFAGTGLIRGGAGPARPGHPHA